MPTIVKLEGRGALSRMWKKHTTRECPEKGVACFTCGNIGHYSDQCSQQKAEPASRSEQTGRRMTTGRDVFTLSGAKVAQSKNLIQGKYVIRNKILIVLYDSGATHSFVSLDCVRNLKLPFSSLNYDLLVSTPTNDLLTTLACFQCPIIIENRKFLVDLICLSLSHIDIILGLHWLSSNHILLNCSIKSLIFDIIIHIVTKTHKDE
jgi:hypothetical protein